MQTLIQKWGDGLALWIPTAVASEAQLEKDTLVEVTLHEGKLVVTPIAAPPTLEELLALVTPENLHSEQDWGEPVGRESW